MKISSPYIIFYFTGVLVIFSLIALSGVMFQLIPRFEVLEGNNSYNQGDYERATIQYFKAMEYNLNQSYIEYNLGNVYFALGESEIALATLEEILLGESQEVYNYVLYNLGNYYYELGQYEKAVSYYIDALKIEPNCLDAKINLEYALKKIKHTEQRQNDQQNNELMGQSTPETEKLLEIIKNKEMDYWSRYKVKEIEPGLNIEDNIEDY